MADRLRIGMIGCGEIAVQTARGIAASASAQHAIVMDVDAWVASDLAGTYGVPHTNSVEELLASRDVDAVYIAVPHYLHVPLALQAIRAGKHVLLEKPIATTLADADALIAAARQAKLTLGVAFTAQVDPVSQRIRELIGGGAVGKVVGTKILYRADKPETYWHGGYSQRIQTDWRTSKQKSGGGILIMNASHELNKLRFLTGLEVVRVYAEYDTFTTPVEVEDLIAVTYRYDNGAIGSVEAGSAIRGKDPLRDTHRIYGEFGQIILDREHPQIYVTREAAGLEADKWQDAPLPPGPPTDERTATVEGFARAVLEGRDPPVTGEDGRAVLEIVVAAYQSGATHQAVNLPL